MSDINLFGTTVCTACLRVRLELKGELVMCVGVGVSVLWGQKSETCRMEIMVDDSVVCGGNIVAMQRGDLLGHDVQFRRANVC